MDEICLFNSPRFNIRLELYDLVVKQKNDSIYQTKFIANIDLVDVRDSCSIINVKAMSKYWLGRRE